MHVQARLGELCTDERGRFPVYGPATYAVITRRGADSFYEVCEAVWAHWQRVRAQQPDLDPDAVFYWLDALALPAAEFAAPVAAVAAGGALEQVWCCLCFCVHACLKPGLLYLGVDLISDSLAMVSRDSLPPCRVRLHAPVVSTRGKDKRRQASL